MSSINNHIIKSLPLRTTSLKCSSDYTIPFTMTPVNLKRQSSRVGWYFPITSPCDSCSIFRSPCSEAMCATYFARLIDTTLTLKHVQLTLHPSCANVDMSSPMSATYFARLHNDELSEWCMLRGNILCLNYLGIILFLLPSMYLLYKQTIRFTQ